MAHIKRTNLANRSFICLFFLSGRQRSAFIACLHAKRKLQLFLPSPRCVLLPRYNAKRICIAFRATGAQMPHSYKELIKSNPDETEIRSFLIDGEQVSVTLRIPDALRDAAKEEAALRGMSFSAFVRTCMIEELAKKGA